VWFLAGVAVADGEICTPRITSGAKVWMRTRTERLGFRPGAWVVQGPVDVGAGNPVLFTLTATIAPSGTTTVEWTKNSFAQGVRLAYEVGPQSATPTYPNSIDVDADDLQEIIGSITVQNGQKISIRATPYTGYSGGAVSGTAGLPKYAYAYMNQEPVGSAFSSAFSTAFG
jgi:hypothetical protein